ncbi:MAG: M56 family metallopeptidase [Bryobacteraceae bacterium]|jgi:Zn-dependent protease with chaperone function
MTDWIAAAALGPLLNGIVIGVGLAAAVWLLLRLAPRSNVTTRYAVWWATLAAIVGLPALMVEAPVGKGTGDAVGALLTLPAPGGWVLWALGAWLAVSAAMLVRLAWGYRSMRRLKRRAQPLPLDPSLNAGQRRVRLCASGEIGVPMAAGLFNPVILIPESLPSQLSQEELRQVLVHELAHIRRWDDWTNLAQKIAEAVFFFHPAVLWIARRLDLEREIACDDWVVSMTGAARPYAACLTRLVALGAFSRGPRLAPGAVARKRQVSHRIESLVRRQRSGSTRFSKIGMLAGSGALAMMTLLAVHAAPIAVAEPSIAALPSRAKPIPVVQAAYAKPAVRPPAARPVARARQETARSMVVQQWTYVVYFEGGEQVRWVTILWMRPAAVRTSPGRT